MENRIEAIVRQVVKDYFSIKTKPSKNLFILVDQHTTPISHKVWEMIGLLANRYVITVCSQGNGDRPRVPGDVNEIHLTNENLEQIKQQMEKSDLFILANPQYSNLAKLALTIDDTLGTWITLQMQLNGKKIIFLSDFLHQEGTQKVTSPQTVNDRIQSYIRQLKKDGVQFISIKNIEKGLSSYFEENAQKRHIVLAKHVKEVAEAGEKELVVPKESLITPMCKEYAKELGILINQKE